MLPLLLFSSVRPLTAPSLSTPRPSSLFRGLLFRHPRAGKKALIFDGAVNASAASLAQLTVDDLRFLFNG